MSASFVNLLPMAIVAFGAMVCIATERFVADKNKQKGLRGLQARSLCFLQSRLYL